MKRSRVSLAEPQLPSDRDTSIQLISGKHYSANTSHTSATNRLSHARARRIDHSDETKERVSAF